MTLTIKDLEDLQAQHPNYRMELVDGEIIVMSPSSYESDEVAFTLGRLLGNWVEPRRLGRVTASSAGFVLPNSNLRAPDVSFVRAEKMPRTARGYAEIVPDLVVEVKSPSDLTHKLREKIAEFLAQGTLVGILIDPISRQIEIYRPDHRVEKLQDGDLLALPDLLPGFEVPVSQLWSPVFED